MAKEQKAASMFGGTTINVHLANADALHQIQTSLDSINSKLEKLMSQVDDLKTVLDNLGTATATAVTNITNLLQQIAASANDPAKIAALTAEAQAELDALNAANAQVPTP